jgi:hypothetical protein
MRLPRTLTALSRARLLVRYSFSESMPFDNSIENRAASVGAEVIDQWGGSAVLRALPMDRPVVLSQVNPDAMQFDQPLLSGVGQTASESFRVGTPVRPRLERLRQASIQGQCASYGCLTDRGM